MERRSMMMFDDTLYSKFIQLSSEKAVKEVFPVFNINENTPHLLGRSVDGYPVFFIKTTDIIKTPDISLELFKVLFNRKCSVANVETEEVSKEQFSIIQLNSGEEDLQRYFIEVVSLIVFRFTVPPTTQELKSEISKVIELFINPQKLSLDIIKGLWTELFVIEQSNNPDFLIKSWHVGINDKYDFNDGENKIEVKSSSGPERIHHFSLEQLNPNNGSELLIASIITVNSGAGQSIFDLCEKILMRIMDEENGIKLKETILTTIGNNVKQVEKVCFDYKLATDSYRLFDYHLVPSINKANVPLGVNHVSFRSCLDGIVSIDRKDEHFDNILFKSL